MYGNLYIVWLDLNWHISHSTKGFTNDWRVPQDRIRLNQNDLERPMLVNVEGITGSNDFKSPKFSGCYEHIQHDKPFPQQCWDVAGILPQYQSRVWIPVRVWICCSWDELQMNQPVRYGYLQGFWLSLHGVWVKIMKPQARRISFQNDSSVLLTLGPQHWFSSCAILVHWATG